MKTLIETKCTGEAHTNAYIDHCGVCMGHGWGVLYMCPHCYSYATKRHGKSRKCKGCNKISRFADTPDYTTAVGCSFNHNGDEGVITAYDTDTYAQPMFIVRFSSGRTGVLKPNEIGAA